MSNELVNVESSNALIKAFENNENGWSVRTTIIDGKPYFAGSDIAKCLQYKVPKDAVSRYCKGALSRRHLTNGGIQELKFISIGDVGRLITGAANQSQSDIVRESAKIFESWLYDDVLTSVMLNGMYKVGDKVPQTFLEALELAVEKEKQRLALEQKYIEAENRAQENQEVKELYDATNASEEYWLPMKTVADVLDVIGIGRNNLYKFLREKHILSQNNEPMRCYQEMGYIRSSYVSGFKNQIICVVSLKGLKFIFKKLQNAELIPRTTKMEEWLKLCTALDSDNVNTPDVVVDNN